MLKVASDSESRVCALELYDRILYLSYLSALVPDMEELREHMLKVFQAVKRDLEQKQYLLSEHKKRLERRQNYSEIREIRGLERLEDEMSLGAQSGVTRKIVSALFEIFDITKRVDAELFDFVYTYFLENAMFFETDELLKIFRHYSSIISYVNRMLSEGHRQGQSEGTVSQRATEKYYSKRRELKKQDRRLVEELIPVLNDRRRDVTFHMRMVFFFSLIRMKYGQKVHQEFLKELYLETFELMKKELRIISRIKGVDGEAPSGDDEPKSRAQCWDNARKFQLADGARLVRFAGFPQSPQIALFAGELFDGNQRQAGK